VVESQFQELENEILENPGAIEPWLIRRRAKTNLPFPILSPGF